MKTLLILSLIAIFGISCADDIQPIVVEDPEVYELFYSKKYNTQTGQFYDQFNAWLHCDEYFELHYVFPDKFTFVSSENNGNGSYKSSVTEWEYVPDTIIFEPSILIGYSITESIPYEVIVQPNSVSFTTETHKIIYRKP